MSGLMSIEDLRSKVPSFQQTLSSYLEEQLQPITLVRPADFDQRVESYYDLVNANDKNDEAFEDILLSMIEGRPGTVTEDKLAKELCGLLGGDEKKWQKRIAKLADLKAYMPGQQEPDPKAHPNRSVWEVKRKLWDKLAPYCSREEIQRCRKIRLQKLKLLKILYSLIWVLGKPGQELTPEDQDPKDLYLKFFKQQENLNILTGKIVKKPKKAKKDSKVETKATEAGEKVESAEAIEQKDIQMRVEEVQEKKAPASTASSNPPTPEKMSKMDIEEPEIEIIEKPTVTTTEKPKQKISKPKAKKAPKTPKPEKPEAVAEQPKPTQPIKPNSQRKLFDFFQKKQKHEHMSQRKQEKPQQMEIEPTTTLTQFEEAMRDIGLRQGNLADLRKQFQKPGRNSEPPKNHYIHLLMWDSGYFMNGYELIRDVKYACPVDKYSEINYEDSYQEYIEYVELLKADNLEKEEEKSQQNSEDSNEGSIVSDGHLSREEFSSQSEAQPQQKPLVQNLQGGDQWHWSNPTFSTKADCMICLVDQLQPLPLIIKTDKQKITNAQRLQFLKILHGSYQSAEDLISKLRQKMPQMSRYQIKLHMNEFSQKEKGCPRLIKGYFLNQMEESIATEGIDLPAMVAARKNQREEFKVKRREERKKEKEREKMEKEKMGSATLLGFTHENKKDDGPDAGQQQQQPNAN